ncbi:methyl-accepting chemotaxis protein, partial [Vibrio parahaemolyticus]|nr:methyl-accepting chemotaxis protein [Vibrio parahaemolyticus]
MNHYLRFFIVFAILWASNYTYALEAHVTNVYWRGCASRGDWVDPYEMNKCFTAPGSYYEGESCTFQSIGSVDNPRFRTACGS